MRFSIKPLDPKLITGPADDMSTPRSPGLHLSQIYQDLENTLYPREPMEEEQLNSYRAAGFVWERFMDEAFRRSLVSERFVRPEEFYLDGITGSPDLIDVEEWAVVDTKFSWKSCRKLEALEKYHWTWLLQLKGYCKMIGTQEARLLVFSCNGDYKPPVPKLFDIRLGFSQLEIDETWTMLKNHARMRGWL